MMFKKILVPVDGSTVAQCAFPVAATFSARTGASIRVVMVRPRDDEDFEPNRAYLETAVQALTEMLPATVSVTSHLLDGPVAQALIADAEAHSDLVVMGSHGHGGFTRAWLGSVTDAVLQQCLIPVVVVKPEATGQPCPWEQGHITKILVPLDGTASAETAIDPAIELAHLFGATVTCLTILPSFGLTFTNLLDDPDQVRVLRDSRAAEARRYSAIVRSRFDHAGDLLEFRVGVQRSPATGVLEFVHRSATDFVVLASNIDPGGSHGLFADVAGRIVRGCPVPVMVVLRAAG